MYYNKKISCDCNNKNHHISLPADNKGILYHNDIRFQCPVLDKEIRIKKEDLMIPWEVEDTCFEIIAYRI